MLTSRTWLGVQYDCFVPTLVPWWWYWFFSTVIKQMTFNVNCQISVFFAYFMEKDSLLATCRYSMQRNVECRDTCKQAHLHASKSSSSRRWIDVWSFAMRVRNLGATIYYVLFDYIRIDVWAIDASSTSCWWMFEVFSFVNFYSILWKWNGSSKLSTEACLLNFQEFMLPCGFTLGVFIYEFSAMRLKIECVCVYFLFLKFT